MAAAGVSDGAIIIDTRIDNSGAIKNANELIKALNGLKQSIDAMGKNLGSIGRRYTQTMQQGAQSTRTATAEMQQLQQRVVELNREMDRMRRAGITGENREQFRALDEELRRVVSEMNELRRAGRAWEQTSTQAAQASEQAADAERDRADAEREAAGAARAAAKSNNVLGVSFRNMLKYGLGIRSMFVLFNRLRTAIKEGFRELRKQSPEVDKALTSLKNALTGLKGSLTTAFAPILTAVEPALTTLINLLARAINAIGAFMAALTGRGYYYVANVANAVEAVGNAASNANDEVKDLKRQLAGFDELNVLSQSGGSGGGSGGGGSGSGGGLTFVQTELTGGLAQISQAVEAALQDSLSRITMMVGAAELAVGAILLLTGANVPLGLGILASGAVTMASAIFANWEGVSGEVKRAVGAVEAALAGGLAVGAILAFSGGNIPLGIGLMVGALSSGLGAVTIAWNSLGNTIKDKVKAIAAIVGGASLGVGAVLAFSGHPEIGIPLMIAGVSVSAVAINWDFLMQKLKGPIGAVTALISGASLALGILALLSGNVPVGLGLILAGTSGLATSIAANWDNLVNLGKTAISKVKEGWETVKQLTIDAYVALKKKFSEWADDVWDFLVAGSEEIVKTVKAVGEGIAAFATNVWLWIRNGDEEIYKTVEAIGKGIASFATSAWLWIRNGAEEIVKTVKAIGDGIAAFADSVWQWIRRGDEAIEKTVQAVGEGIATFATNAWLWIRNGNEDIAKTVEAVGKGIATFAENVWLWIRKGDEAIEKTVKAIGDGIATFATSVWLWIRGGAETINKTVKAVGEGVATFATNVWTWIRNGDEAITKSVKAAADKLEGFTGKIWDFILGMPTVTKNLVINITENVSKWFRSLWTWLSGGGEEITSQTSTAYGDVELTAIGDEELVPDGAGGYYWRKKITADADATVNVDIANDSPKWAKNIKTWLNTALKGDNIPTFAAQLKNDAATWWDNAKKWWGKAVKSGGQLGTFSVGVKDNRTGWWDKVKKWWGKAVGKETVEFSVKPANNSKSWWDSVKSWWDGVKKTLGFNVSANGGKFVGGGYVTNSGRFGAFASGGAVRGSVASWWNTLPKYASGTRSAHGTMFLAGEAGPEIVGHVGGRTEVLNKSQLAQTMFAAVENGMLAAASRIEFHMPAMASGTVLPYDVSAQIAKTGQDIMTAMDANNEDLIQTIISVAGQIVNALGGLRAAPAVGGMTAQQVINALNQRTQMFGESPLQGV